jgi:putative pyruvate formate lyase activating enzyme
MCPRYLELLKSGELLNRVRLAYRSMKLCTLCPRSCKADRLAGEKGFCFISKHALVSSHNSHHGEEPPISGNRGSGTIFFASCNMRCIFCQNYPISWLRHGKTVTPHELARMMLSLQSEGCHNINLVTPSHVVPQFMAGLYIAAKEGLNIPIVYNSSGYDGLESLKLLDGIIDIYMPDIKYSSNDEAERYSKAPDYWDAVRPAIKEMQRQVGELKLDKDGVAISGLLIRHLVLPQDISGTDKVLEFIANEISKETYISLMSQYFPANKAMKHPALHRRVNPEEFGRATETFHKLGLKNGWLQEVLKS